MTDKQLDEVLEELGREHRAIGAPDSLQGVLCAAAESRKAGVGRARVQFPWAWAAVAALLVVVAGAGVIWRSLETRQTEQARSLPAPQVTASQVGPAPLHVSPVTARQGVESNAGPVREAVKTRGPVRHASPQASLWRAPTVSSLDAFVPLPASEGLPPAAELSIVRMRLRGSDLQQYGLQTPADAMAQTMLAEFAVGDDGLPRAIRIVR